MKLFSLVSLSFAFTGFSYAAQAQSLVIGKGDAVLCYQYAQRGNSGSNSAIEACSEGLTQDLNRKDKVATFINRGILFMRNGEHNLASKDFESAIKLKPGIPEAYINYSASLIGQKRYDEALQKVNIALEEADNVTRPQALYNRAVIFDHQENYKGAYFDLKEALTLRPDWKPALTLISRYEVRKAG